MNLRARTTALAVSLFTATLAAPAWAEPVSTAGYPTACSEGSVSKAASDTAHETFKAGKRQYDNNKWDVAITLFKDAYNTDCSKHELLIIIARAYELKGDHAEALRAYEIFLQRDPSNAEAPTYRNRIAEHRAALAAANQAPAGPGTPPPPPSQAGEVRTHTALPWVVVGLGGVALIGGIVVLATVPGVPAGCSPQTFTCPQGSSAAVKSTASRSQDQPVAGAIILGGGFALVGVGLLWHFLEPTGPAEASGKMKLEPAVAPGYAGLSLGASF